MEIDKEKGVLIFMQAALDSRYINVIRFKSLLCMQ